VELDFNINFLNHILLQSILDTEFLKRIRPVIEPDLFKTKEKKFLIRLIYDYYDEYNKAPEDHFYDIIEYQKKQISKELYNKSMDVIKVLRDIDHSNPEFILGEIKNAVKHFKLEEAAVNFAQLIKIKQYDQAEKVIIDAIKSTEDIKQEYFNFFDDTEYIEKRIQGKSYKMRSLIPGLDKLIGGFNPAWLITILGAAKFGKTTMLVELSVAAMLQGLKVLFVTGEMSKQEIVDKFDQCIGFFSNTEHETIETMTFKNEKWVKIKKKVDSIYDINKVIKSRNTIQRLGGDLYIADCSSGRVNWMGVDLIQDKIQQTHGHIFDVTVVDYLGIMKATEKGQNKKERIAENTLGLKELSKKRHQIIFTAQQGNRKAMTAKIFRSNEIADAIEPIFDSDVVLAICQTPTEEKYNVSRIYIAENRHGPRHQDISLVRDLARGQIALGEATENLLFKEDSENEDVDY